MKRIAILGTGRIGEALLSGLLSSGWTDIVVTARTRGTVPTALWNSSYFVFVGEPEPKAV